MSKIKVAFVCIHNSCRSQMAEGWMKNIGQEIVDCYSAGTEDYPEVKPNAIKVMKEVGIDISHFKPKRLKDIPNKFEILITMGCGVDCPLVNCDYRKDWNIEDPSEGTIDDFRKARDSIKIKVEELLTKIKSNG